MEGLIEEFLSFLYRRGNAGNTILSYGADLKQFAQFCLSEKKSLAQLDQEIIRGFLNWLEGNFYAPVSLNRKLAVLRSFLNWLEMEGKIEENPTKGIPAFQSVGRPLQTLTAGEIERLLEIPARSLKPVAIRDLAIMEVFLSTGLRVSELVELDVGMINLDPENPEVQVTSKGRRRQIPIPLEVAQDLGQYLDKVRPIWVGKKTEKALFVNQKGEGLTRQGVWLILRERAKAAGLKGRINPRTLRHSFAAQQLASGASQEKLQQLLGYTPPYTILRLTRRLQAKD